MRNTITAIATASALAVGSIGTASALGSDGEKALQVLGGIYVIEKIVEYGEHRERSRQPRYEGPITSGEERAYRRGVLQREREAAARRERRAYECGYTGRC